jgi:LmbE family N-acetylglucosaminyl deacetylase
MGDTILSVLAHPDDAEILCAGTLARLRQERHWQVHIASMTPGDCGSAELGPEEIAAVRRAEGAAAAAQIGATYNCLEERDLLLTYNERALEKVTRLIREVRPRVILTHSPECYMLDHEVTSTLTRAAAFAAAVPNFLASRGLPPALEAIPHLYYCDPIEGKGPLGQPIPPGLRIDITSVIDVKSSMLAAHASQRDWLRRQHGMDQYLAVMREWSARRGAEVGVAFAEGFRQHLGHSYPQADLLGELLGRAG